MILTDPAHDARKVNFRADRHEESLKSRMILEYPLRSEGDVSLSAPQGESAHAFVGAMCHIPDGRVRLNNKGLKDRLNAPLQNESCCTGRTSAVYLVHELPAVQEQRQS